jgi:hypothetical protein
MSSNRQRRCRFKNARFMRVFYVLALKMSSKWLFLGPKPATPLPGQKNGFFICSGSKVDRQENQAQHFEN